MYTRTFHCVGFDDKPYDVTYDFYLSRADLLKIDMEGYWGLEAVMQKLIDTHNGAEIMKIIDKIIMMAVGKESMDHRRFLRDEDIKKEFRESDAYSQLFEELCTDAEKAAAFLNGCLPASVLEEAAKRKQEEENAAKAEAQ